MSSVHAIVTRCKYLMTFGRIAQTMILTFLSKQSGGDTTAEEDDDGRRHGSKSR